ncbi:MAG TPA: glycosyltransferase [Alphaproteobacteria bacterium]|nr:glycosyltransferase [Alphaproteobacteria bacterium]
MRISVIIPHRNDFDNLKVCLESLAGQQSEASAVEILVVDNGSAISPESICSSVPGVRLVIEPEPGPGPARNRGIAEAKGDILAFTDSDCRVDRGWLAAILDAFRDPEVSVAGGDIIVKYADPSAPTLIEPYERVYSFRNRSYIRKGFSAAANLAVRRTVFDRVGGFGGRGIAEDQDWGLRASATGFKPVYLPAMVVFHPARPSLQALLEKWNRHIAHDYNALPAGAGARLRWSLRALLILFSPPAEIPRLLSSAQLRGPRTRALAIIVLFRIRAFRAWRMLGLLARARSKDMFQWNEPKSGHQGRISRT